MNDAIKRAELLVRRIQGALERFPVGHVGGKHETSAPSLRHSRSGFDGLRLPIRRGGKKNQPSVVGSCERVRHGHAQAAKSASNQVSAVFAQTIGLRFGPETINLLGPTSSVTINRKAERGIVFAFAQNDLASAVGSVESDIDLVATKFGYSKGATRHGPLKRLP